MFIVVSTGLYNEKLIEANVASVDAQTRQDFTHLLVLDNSPVSVRALMPSKNRMTVYNQGRNFDAKNTYNVLSQCSGNDVVCIVNADDTIEPNALEVVGRCFEDESVLMTHGSYRTVSGAPARFNGPYKEGEDIRLSPWRCSHLKAFRLNLWRYMTQHYRETLMDRKRRFLKTASDVAIMMALYELAGHDRVRYVPEVIYVYNDVNPMNDHKVMKQDQKDMELWIRNRRPLRRMP